MIVLLTNLILRSFDKLRKSKQIEQRECKGAITAITLRPAIIEGNPSRAGKFDLAVSQMSISSIYLMLFHLNIIPMALYVDNIPYFDK